MLGARTEKEYRWYVRRWQGDGQPKVQEWLDRFPGAHQRRNARAAMVWWHRTELGATLVVPSVPVPKRVPEAFDERQLAIVRRAARLLHPRAGATIDMLYTTGARISELTGIGLEDCSPTHVVLRETKRRPGGLRVERVVPLNRVSAQAVLELRSMPPGRVNNLVGVRAHTVQDWCRVLSQGTGMRVHPHKLRATFCTHLLQRGVPVFEVQRLMGHTDIATTLRYAAVTDERLVAAVALLT